MRITDTGEEQKKRYKGGRRKGDGYSGQENQQKVTIAETD